MLTVDPKNEGNQFLGLSLVLSPHGRLSVEAGDDFQVASEAGQRIFSAFRDGQIHGLIHLASKDLTTPLPVVLTFWRDIARLFFTKLCAVPELDEVSKTGKSFELLAPRIELEEILKSAPVMPGGEYLTFDVLERIWCDLLQEVHNRLLIFKGSAEEYFISINPAWNLLGRVCFHLAENKQSTSHPFGFLATYTSKLSSRAKAQHLPLGRAINEMSSSGNNNALLALLKPVQRASEKSLLVKEMIETGDIYHPIAWTADQAYRFLKDIPIFEASGVLVRVPNWWRSKNSSRPVARVTVGDKKPSRLGLEGLMDFEVTLSLDGEELSKEEWQQIRNSTDGLISLRGQWVEIDNKKLSEVLDHWKKIEENIADDGISFADAMRLLAGTSRNNTGAKEVSATSDDAAQWSSVVAGSWLERTLTELRNPDGAEEVSLPETLKATLRPYQQKGLQWLWLLNRLQLGACLADDMGLGKTVQILALLLKLKQKEKTAKSLLVVPASLIGNWLAEAKKFAPTLKISVLHPSALKDGEPSSFEKQVSDSDLSITTYGLLSRYSWLADTNWNLIVLDEAQAIKNPGSRQTIAAKTLKARHLIALTGTPVENRLSDLWSIFDFICPGLMGSAKEFNQLTKERVNPYPAIRSLVSPYILRRLKTDKDVISDLPEKNEVRAFCSLSKVQAALYEAAVVDLGEKIKQSDGIQRRGIILSFLMRFKQICNHPSQWTGDGVYDPAVSGKFKRLREICEEIAARQEKVLVFTQFRAMSEPLHAYLAGIFGKDGLILHGGTVVKKRKALVDAFQEENGPPFFVLSLKAGGTGLNLTAASHVIHFDRWWNPAVENQATDRAFRIGQKRSVMVHKFVCQGTVEGKIDAMIEDKKAMASQLLSGSGEVSLTEMSNAELMSLVALDLKSALDRG